MTARTYAQQKAALTRALRTGPDAVLAECRRARAEWDASYWPDDWARWQRALWDSGWRFDLDDI